MQSHDELVPLGMYVQSHDELHLLISGSARSMRQDTRGAKAMGTRWEEQADIVLEIDKFHDRACARPL